MQHFFYLASLVFLLFIIFHVFSLLLYQSLCHYTLILQLRLMRKINCNLFLMLFHFFFSCCTYWWKCMFVHTLIYYYFRWIILSKNPVHNSCLISSIIAPNLIWYWVKIKINKKWKNSQTKCLNFKEFFESKIIIINKIPYISRGNRRLNARREVKVLIEQNEKRTPMKICLYSDGSYSCKNHLKYAQHKHPIKIQ